MEHVEHHEEHHHHIVPIPKLFGVFVLLAILMVFTVGWAIYAEKFAPSTGTSIMNNLIAMGIAVTKAVLVIQIFMGVKFQTNLVKSFAILGFVWASLLTFVFCDYATRSFEPVRGWGDSPTLALPRASEPQELGIPPRSEIHPDTEGH